MMSETNVLDEANNVTPSEASKNKILNLIKGITLNDIIGEEIDHNKENNITESDDDEDGESEGITEFLRAIEEESKNNSKLIGTSLSDECSDLEVSIISEISECRNEMDAFDNWRSLGENNEVVDILEVKQDSNQLDLHPSSAISKELPSTSEQNNNLDDLMSSSDSSPKQNRTRVIVNSLVKYELTSDYSDAERVH
ncbi:unnamed protein product [Psylliodes chrysocephalus]|uniref:Uncharacterized protein n=1 Tax=Psylliodes chrysocephalus TaxID=3402493 RepID=A0A9P0D0Q9_9CUCU|nr:unnamed protein product [Psylliodes chrysocephala]